MHTTKLFAGMDAFIERIHSQKKLYERICAEFHSSTANSIALNSTSYGEKVIELFGPSLSQNNASVDLKKAFEGYFHPRTGSLLVTTSGTTLLCQTPSGKGYFILRHIGCALLHPSLGVEMVNIGIVGNIYAGPVIVRSESACAPSFLFNSQRCNCCYQWASTREIAGFFHPIAYPTIDHSEMLERWVENQFIYKENRHLPVSSSKGPGVLLIHLDSQGGMGSGYSPGELSYDLTTRAFLRQLGENSIEQLYHTTIKESYAAIGVAPDSRKEENGAGYHILPIVLDCLGASRDIALLSNNTGKLEALKEYGYCYRRIQSLGKIDQAGLREAKQRNSDFQHLDIGQVCISFEEEVERIKKELAFGQEREPISSP